MEGGGSKINEAEERERYAARHKLVEVEFAALKEILKHKRIAYSCLCEFVLLNEVSSSKSSKPSEDLLERAAFERRAHEEKSKLEREIEWVAETAERELEKDAREAEMRLTGRLVAEHYSTTDIEFLKNMDAVKAAIAAQKKEDALNLKREANEKCRKDMELCLKVSRLEQEEILKMFEEKDIELRKNCHENKATIDALNKNYADLRRTFYESCKIVMDRFQREKEKILQEFAEREEEIALKMAAMNEKHHEENLAIPADLKTISKKEDVPEDPIEVIRNNIMSSQNATRVNKLEQLFHSKFYRDFVIHGIVRSGELGYIFTAESLLDFWKYTVQRVAVEKSAKIHVVRMMCALDHPNIVRYHSTWIEQPPPGWQFEADMEMLKGLVTRDTIAKNSEHYAFIYIQMQLMERTLKNWLEENNSPRSRLPDVSKTWFKEIVSGVAYLHHNSIIHRDLKPSNILISENGRMKICDLGITTYQRNIHDNETELESERTGETIYKAPEQTYLTTPYSSKVDIFALGLILAEMCIVMTDAERAEIFDNYRLGKQTNLFDNDETAEFVAWLTGVDPRNRPSCNEILDHPFLANCDSDY